MNRRAICLALLGGLLPAGWACREQEPAASEAIPPRVEAVAEPLEPTALQTVNAEPAHLRSGPGGQGFDVARRTPEIRRGHSRRIGLRTFQVALRATELTSDPCTSCHLGATVIDRERVADAHQNVQPVHPAETGAACVTCHDARNVERLVLESGETATLNQAYRLCAQCHFTQVDAWAGGAHGKRLDAWDGRRIVMGCADCHDPHRPGVEKRIPFPGPRLPSRPAHRE